MDNVNEYDGPIDYAARPLFINKDTDIINIYGCLFKACVWYGAFACIVLAMTNAFQWSMLSIDHWPQSVAILVSLLHIACAVAYYYNGVGPTAPRDAIKLVDFIEHPVISVIEAGVLCAALVSAGMDSSLDPMQKKVAIIGLSAFSVMIPAFAVLIKYTQVVATYRSPDDDFWMFSVCMPTLLIAWAVQPLTFLYTVRAKYALVGIISEIAVMSYSSKPASRNPNPRHDAALICMAVSFGVGFGICFALVALLY